jgi:hypothetical protein
MEEIKLNFALFSFWCSCGNWKINSKTMSKYLKYAIKVDENIQSFNYAFRCQKCNKIICLKLIVEKHKDEFFITNGGKI